MNRAWQKRTICTLAIGALTCGVWTGCKSNGGSSTTKPKMADAAKEPFWGTFPQESDPKVLGKKVALDLLGRTVIESRPYGVIYPEICDSYGSLRFADGTHDKALLDQLVARYAGMLNPPGVRAPAGQQGGGGGGGARGQGGGRRGARGPASGPATQPEVAAAPATQGAPGRGARGNRGAGGGGGAGAAPGQPQGILLANASAINMVPEATHVDRSVFGVLPLEIFHLTGDKRYLDIGKKSADDQWLVPPNTAAMPAAERAVAEAAMAAGLTGQTRLWIDDMFMIISLQTAAYRATKDPVYMDRAAKSMVYNLKHLQQPNGLFYHADDAHFYWGRGAGWVAAGLTEILLEMPENHPMRPEILAGYKKMMAGLLKVQAPSGMWRQLLDNPESWEETSGTGMFTFAMATGVKRGWLDAKEYKEPARRAWLALSTHLTPEGKVRDVCVGTNKGYTVEYYLGRNRATGDLHGQSGFIWAAWAMLD